VISDTHGYLDPVVLERFAGVAHIIHAGDIVDPEIVAALEGVAPVTSGGRQPGRHRVVGQDGCERSLEDLT
jgi:predicted phosphodiesterase